MGICRDIVISDFEFQSKFNEGSLTANPSHCHILESSLQGMPREHGGAGRGQEESYNDLLRPYKAL